MKHLFFSTRLLCSLLLSMFLFLGATSMWGTTYTKVTSSSQIVSGAQYIFADLSDDDTKYVASTNYGSSKFNSVTEGFSVSNDGNTITVAAGTEVLEVTLSGSAGAWILSHIANNTTYYIGKGDSNTNFTHSTSSPTNNNDKWDIKFDNLGNYDGVYSLYKTTGNKAKDHTNRYWGRNGNSGQNIGPYSGSSYPILSLFKKDTDGTINLSVPTNLSSSDVTATSATLSWDAVEHASSYTVKIGETEYTGVNTNSYSATGLSANTTYTWTVMAVGDGERYNSSEYATPKSFTTAKILNRITISGNLSKTTYEIGDLLNPSGLTVSADYGESEPTDVTASVVWSVYNEDLDEVPSFVTLGTNNYYIQASFGGKSDATDLISITVVEPSKKALVLAYDGVYYAATTSLSNDKLARKEVKVINGKVYVATEADKNAIAWTISETDTKGEYTISPAVGDNSAKYLSAASSSANLSYAETACNWKSKNDDGKISYWISKADGTQEYYRTITYQEGSTKAFKAYTASNIGTSGYASTAAYAAEIVVGDLISVSSAEYATYYNKTMAYTMPEGLVGITVEGVIGNTLTLETRYEAGDVVPAGEALLLHGKEGTYTLYAATTEDAKSEDNMLKGTSTADEMTTGNAGDKYYRLSQHDGQVGFYWGAAEGAAFQPGANKAYLALPGTNAPARFIFGQQDVPTEVVNVNDNNQSTKVLRDGRLYILRDGNMFDLNGRLVK